MRIISKLFIAGAFVLVAVTSQPVGAKAETNEVVCLAKNIYFESRGEALAGKLAVAQVTLNRVKHKQFPKTVCEVVYQPRQFSWTANKRQMIRDAKAWRESLEIARSAVGSGITELRGFTAIYFHSGRKPPDWGKVRLVAKIGKHKFYVA